MNNPTVIVLVVAALGALARTLVPFLQLLAEKPDTPFDRQFLVPPIVSCLIALITLPLALAALPKELLELPSVTAMGLVNVFLLVWGATDAARAGQKFVGALFLSGNKS